jgi:hypothetical protein
MLNIKKWFSKSKQTTYFNYISKKHIDFVITDLNWNIKVLIELDWFSHNFDKTKKSDDFKNKVFENLNIPLKRFNVSNSYDFSVLENLL